MGSLQDLWQLWVAPLCRSVQVGKWQRFVRKRLPWQSYLDNGEYQVRNYSYREDRGIPFEVRAILIIGLCLIGLLVMNCAQVTGKCNKYESDGATTEVRGPVYWPTCYAKVGEEYVPR